MNNKEFFNHFAELRQKIRNGEALWNDAVELRKEYNMPEIAKETLRKGVFVFDEYFDAGLIKMAESADKIDSEGIFGVNKYKETVEIKNDGTLGSDKVIELSEDNINDIESLLKAHGFNPDEYELISAKNSRWQQYNKKDGIKNLYSSKITVKPKKNQKSEVEDLKKYFEDWNFNHKPYIYCQKDKNTNKIPETLVICLYDVHFGRLSALDHDDYNCEIAKEKVIHCFEEYSKKIQDRNIEKIIVIIGQDYLNSSVTGYTSSGRNKQDNDGHYRDIFKKGIEALIEGIERIKSDIPMELILVEGNHARDEEFMLMCCLENYFAKDKDVEIDSSSNPRKYRLIGNTLVGFSHGSEEKERLYSLMQVEQPVPWAISKNRMWLNGHLHHLKMEEKNGVDVWNIPSIANNDNWTERSGYVSQKRTMGYLFSEDNLEDIIFVYV